MQTDWYAGLSDEEKDDIINRVTRSRILLERLETIVDKWILEEEQSSKTDYDSPSWAYRAADKEGYKRALRKIKLLTKEERTN